MQRAPIIPEYGRQAGRRRRWFRERFMPSTIVVLITGAVLYSAYYVVVWWGVPAGVDNPIAWRWWAVDGEPIRSPDGLWVISVRFHDAGAMHSGPHWTWLVARGRWGRRRVIAEGFSTSDVRMGRAPLPVRWIDNKTFDIDFQSQRYRSPTMTRRGHASVIAPTLIQRSIRRVVRRARWRERALVESTSGSTTSEATAPGSGTDVSNVRASSRPKGPKGPSPGTE